MQDNTPQDWINKASQLGKQFAQHATAIEQNRTFPPELLQLIQDAGLWGIGVPKAIGGLALDPHTQCQIFETIAQYDANAAWVTFISATSGTALAALDKETAQSIYTDNSIQVAGVFAPTGIARKCDNGYTLSGRWDWGSGTQSAQWVLAGCQLFDGDEPMTDKHGTPKTTMALVPQQVVKHIDNWYVSGLQGTGSAAFTIEDHFVPDNMLVGSGMVTPIEELFIINTNTYLAMGIGSVALGIAQAALNDIKQLADKKRVSTKKSTFQMPLNQYKYALATASLQASRAHYFNQINTCWQQAQSRKQLTLEQRANMRLAINFAVNQAVETVTTMYRMGGGSSIFDSNPLQRHLRNINVLTQHIMVSDTITEITGKILLEQEGNFTNI